MKKFALALMTSAVVLFGFGAGVSAQYVDPGSGAPPIVEVEAGGPSAVASQAGGLPATGSSGISTTTGIALGLIAVGLGLSIVTRQRRQSSVLH